MAGPHNRSDYMMRGGGPKPTGRHRAEWATGTPQKHHEDVHCTEVSDNIAQVAREGPRGKKKKRRTRNHLEVNG